MIYLDNASTTMPNQITMKYLSNYDKFFGNPSNIYKIGEQTHEMIENARIKVAKAINADPEDIYFTSGASESNVWAIKQSEMCYCSPYEHHSILANPNVFVAENYIFFNEWIKENYDYLHLNEDDEPYLSLGYLFSHMLVNNETGEIFSEQVKNICKSINNIEEKKYRSWFVHTDATQAIGNIVVDVKDLDVDMLSLSGHKIHSPKGVGVLYISHETITKNDIKPLIYGSQENNYRGGTENTLGIVCLGDCIEEASQNIFKKYLHCKSLKNIAIQKLKSGGIDYLINTPKDSISSIINFSLKNINSEVIASILSQKEIYIGTGSACNDSSLAPSYVLKAMDVPKDYIRGSIRLSFDISTKEEEVETAMNEIIKIYKELIK